MKFLIFLSLVILTLFTGCSSSKEEYSNRVESINQGTISYDAIIVPGYPFEGDTLNPIMKNRVLWSIFLYKNGIAKNIIFSGSAVYSKYYESKVMAKYAIEFGIPEKHVFIETNAEHSTENIYYSYRIAKENGFEKVALATDPFQSNSTKYFIKKYQLNIDELPIIYEFTDSIQTLKKEIDYSSCINKSFVSIKEKEGFFKRLGGTFGKNIVWYDEDLPTKRLKKKSSRKKRIKYN